MDVKQIHSQYLKFAKEALNAFEKSDEDIKYLSRLLSKHSLNVAGIVSVWLSNIASVKKNKQKVIKAAELFCSKEMVEVMNKYKSEKLASEFGKYALESDISNIATISKYLLQNDVYDCFSGALKFIKKKETADSLISAFFNFSKVLAFSKEAKAKELILSTLKRAKDESDLKEISSKINNFFSAIYTVPSLGIRTMRTISSFPDFNDVFLNLLNLEDGNEIRELAYLLGNSPGDYKDILSNWNKIKDLKLDYNIDHYGRYPWSVLKSMYENVEKKTEKPLAVFIYAKSDYNGTFYYDYSVIAYLSNYYDVRIIEVDSDRDFETWSLIMKEKYGKANLVVIGGHGTPVDIRLGDGEDLHYKLDLSDEGSFIALSNLLEEKGRLVLNACSTGDPNVDMSLAGKISANLYASSVVIAPEGLTRGIQFKVEKKEGAFFAMVSYSDTGAVGYRGGKKID
jgi:hypothetical protein